MTSERDPREDPETDMRMAAIRAEVEDEDAAAAEAEAVATQVAEIRAAGSRAAASRSGVVSDVEFIRTRLDEDEQVAKRPYYRAWQLSGDGDAVIPAEPEGNAWIAVGPWDGGMAEPDAEHIVRHDPARAVQQAAALSDVLTELEQIADRSSDPDARMHARAAIRRMSLIWQSVDELDAQQEVQP